MRQILLYVFMTVMLVSAALTSCDDHDAVDSTVRVGDVVFADHSTMSYSLFSVDSFAQATRTPVAVVFAEKTETHPALAVLLLEPAGTSLTDSLGVGLGASAVLDSCLGRSNTNAMFATGHSPAAKMLFTVDRGRSAFLPSVYEARLLSASLPKINPIIKTLGGMPVSTDAKKWYWTSSLVSGNETYQAWAFSPSTGSIQPESAVHDRNIRAIIELD